ncbi:MAG: protoheme IX farnesyltransferase, partial [Campylobacterales bacterium]|nr:protoheme IX farnesyltransferase [Campylobacterales bacterium]
METSTAIGQKAGFREYGAFTKAGLSSAVGLPGLLVYLLIAQEITAALWFSLLGIFLLALGVSALNQYQEKELDAKMPRCQNRPLVTGKISPFAAITTISLLIASATVSLYVALGPVGILFSLVVVFLYNGVYTPMKQASPYAVFPGAILGVVPPMICWLAAGGGLLEARFLPLAWLYFIWQIPHFWLLVLVYHKDYASANFPTMVDVMGVNSLARVTYVWILLTIISAFMVVNFFMPQSQIILGLIVAHALFLVYASTPLLRLKGSTQRLTCKKIFLYLNLYMLLVVALLVVDRWFF